MRHSSLRRLLPLVVVGLLAIFGVVTPTSPAYAAGEPTVIGIPFAGKWAWMSPAAEPWDDVNDSHPAEHHHFSADWATDLYTSPGTDVRVKVNAPTSSYTLSVSLVESTSCGAGERVRVSVKYDGNEIGWVQYEHVDPASGISLGAALSNGQVIGQTKNWGYLSCYQVSSNAGVHAHVSMKNTQANHSCYVDHGQPGATTLSYGTDLGVLGSSNGGVRQECSSIPGNGPVTGEYDANPTVAVGSGGAVYTLHVAGDGCAKIHRRLLGTTGFALHANVPSTCSWSKAGFAEMVMVPGTNNQAWMVLAKEVGSSAELYLYSMNGTAVTNEGQIGLGGWSLDAPPALSMDSSGNLYIAAVKSGGDLWRFMRDASGTITNEGLIGDSGTWSVNGTVTLASAPNGDTWLVAVKANGDLWTFKRSVGGTWTNMGSLGLGGWSPWARPGLAVDDDGDITVGAVKSADSDGALGWAYRRCSTCSAWHSVGQLGATTEWSDQGTLELATAPDDRVWAVMVKQGGSGQSTQWAAYLTPDPLQNHQGTWSGWMQVGASAWSPYSAPAVTVAAGGTVFVVKVKADATMHAYQRNSTTGVWGNYGQIGGSGWTGNLP